MELNHKQREAVEQPLIPIVVIAGAGSGKTRVLVERIIYLMKNLNVNPNRILALTFTKKAAGEMNDRINNAGFNNLKWISTYAALGRKILIEDIHLLGRTGKVIDLGTEESESLIRNIKNDYGLVTKINVSKIRDIISKLLLKGYNDFSTIPFAMWNREFAIADSNEIRAIINIYNHYLNYKTRTNSIDYDDMLYLPLAIFQQFPEIAKKWRERFDYILVDEFQDTNEYQYDLLKFLINKDNIFVVGDGDQTIYTWRGAWAKVFDQLLLDVPNAKKIILDINYRSTQNILNAGNQLISNNPNRIHKNLVSHNNFYGDKVKLYEGQDTNDEVNYIVKQIMNKNIDYSSFAILYRAGYVSRAIETELTIHGVPYKVYGGTKFYDRVEVKDIISYLRFINNSNDEVSLLRIINVPRRNIGLTTIQNLKQLAIQNKTTFLDELLKSGNKHVKTFLYEIDKLRMNALSASASEVIEMIIQETKYIEYLKANYDDWEERIQNIEELINSSKKISEGEEKQSIDDYLGAITLLTSSTDNDANDKKVTVSTIHSVKGMEFPIVFVMAMNEGIFPKTNNKNLEEERRLAYVAYTRAKNELYLTYRNGFNPLAMTDYTPSIFIKETIGAHIEKVARTTIAIHNANTLKPFDSTKNFSQSMYNEEVILEIHIGDRIVHTLFGEGLVVDRIDDYIDVVFKSPVGKKKLNAKHKNIVRIIN